MPIQLNVEKQRRSDWFSLVVAEYSVCNLGHYAVMVICYASLTTGVNVSAAVGSVVGRALLLHWSASSVFLLAAIIYGLSGLITMLLPSSQQVESRRLKWGTGLQLSLRLPTLWRAMLSTSLGWFLYTQSYASLPLFVNAGVHRSDSRLKN